MSKPMQELTEIEEYLATARNAGYPEDQMENFLRAEMLLQPRRREGATAPTGPRPWSSAALVAGAKATGCSRSSAWMIASGCRD